MEKIKINSTDDSPNVILDKDNGIFEFSGKSMPEDVIVFYAPIIKWIAEYKKSPNEKTNVICKFVYFNTASSKVILDIFMEFEGIKDTGKEITVTWCYPQDDDDMRDAGNEYSQLVDIPFEIIGF